MSAVSDKLPAKSTRNKVSISGNIAKQPFLQGRLPDFLSVFRYFYDMYFIFCAYILCTTTATARAYLSLV